MKGFKVIIGLIAFIGASSVLAGGFAVSPRQSNYQQFITSYKGDIIDSRLNMVAPAFVYEAAKALRADGMGNLRDPNVATFLWRSIENVVNYYANLPANRSNTQFRNRIWQSLTRSLDELARVQQPIAQQPVAQQSAQSLDRMDFEGFENFKRKTAQIIQTNPGYLYSGWLLQESWIQEALAIMTLNGRIPLTMRNKEEIQKNLIGTAHNLIRPLLDKDPRNLSQAQRNMIIQTIPEQIERFLNARVQQPIAQQPVAQQSAQSLDRMDFEGFENFKRKTAQIIQTNPGYLYSGWLLQESWIQEALAIMTLNGRIPLTMRNKEEIQKNLIGTAHNLIRPLLDKDPRNLSQSQRNMIIQTIREQIERFLNARTMRSRI